MSDSDDEAFYQFQVAGTGFKNADGLSRAWIIERFVSDDMPVYLVPEPDNEHDPNAIAVFIEVKRWVFFGPYRYQIGYINKRSAKSLSKRLAGGGQILESYVRSHHARDGLNFPRVSIAVIGDWKIMRKQKTVKAGDMSRWLPGDRWEP